MPRSAVLLLLLSLSSPAVAATPISFIAPHNLTAIAPGAAALAVADFDRDGFDDVAVASVNQAMTILHANGDGTFATTDYPLPVWGTYVVTGDLNGDGNLDVVMSSYSSGNVVVLRGDGRGAFTLLPPIPAGNATASLALGDFNGDGRMDIAVSNFSSSRGYVVAVLAANADGSFAAPAISDVKASKNDATFSIAAGDFNRDGKLDLVASLYLENSVAFLPGTGDAKFATPLFATVSGGPSYPTVSDFDRDGKLDVLTTSFTGDSALLFGNGDGTFRVTAFAAGGGSAYAPVVGDFTGDGRTDLIVALVRDGVIRITTLSGDGRGSFTELATQPLLTGAFAVGHFSAAHTTDVVTIAYPGHAALLPSNEDGTFRGATAYAVDRAPRDKNGETSWHHIAVADFDGDGRPEIAASNDRVNTVSIFHVTKDGALSSANKVALPVAADDIAAGDFDGDGRADFAVLSIAASTTSIFRNTGDGTFSLLKTFSLASALRNFAVADLNGDGKPDVVITLWQSVVVELNRGGGAFAETTLANVHPSRGQRTIIADFDGDGRVDLVSLSATNNTGKAADTIGAIAFWKGNGDGTFAARQSVEATDGPTSGAAADFNGDGKLDLATTGFAQVTIRLGIGDGTFAPPQKYTVGTMTSLIATADFNRDGVADLVALDLPYNALFAMAGNGDGTFGTPSGFAVGGYPTHLTVADVNADGRPDVITVLSRFADAVEVLLNETTAPPRHRVTRH
jgi:hypothetical protein